MQNERASKKQQELLQFVDEFIKTNGYGPSYREVMRGLGYKSVSTVAIHIEHLISKGYLVRRDKSARSLEVVSTATPPGPTTDDLNTKLEAYIVSRPLEPEQLSQVIDALHILGLDTVAKRLKKLEES